MSTAHDSEPLTETSRQPSGTTTTDAETTRHTRTQALWTAAAAFTLVLLLLVVFLLQNGQRVEVSYFGADGHVPLAVAMLLSAVAGALLVLTAGAARVLQLRRAVRREHRSH